MMSIQRYVVLCLAAALLLIVGCDKESNGSGGGEETAIELIAPGGDPAQDGPWAVVTTEFNKLTDSSRRRDIPTTVYAPDDDTQSFPYVILSHGLGADRTHYIYLARHLASHGYVVAVPEHVGSSSRLSALQLATALNDEDEWLDRCADVSFLIDMAARWNFYRTPLHGKIDLSRIGITGHSYGGATSQWSSGAEANLSTGPANIGDPRIDCAVPLAGGGTPDTAQFTYWFTVDSFNNVSMPVMHIVGEQDRWIERKGSHDHMPNGDKYYLVLEKVDHLDFTDALLNYGTRKARTNLIVKAMVLAFFDSYLKGDASSRQQYLVESYADSLTNWRVPDVWWFEK